jgi:hypothetical protein
MPKLPKVKESEVRSQNPEGKIFILTPGSWILDSFLGFYDIPLARNALGPNQEEQEDRSVDEDLGEG